MRREAVICDGDLPALVMLCIATERWHLEAGGAAGGGPMALVEEFGAAVPFVRRQAELLGCEAVEVPEVEGESRMLLAAALAAGTRGATRLVWPVTLGALVAPGGAREPDDLDAVALACDRAILVGRLASLDLSGAGIVVEAPLADLSDRQVAELALDLDAPVELCRWWGVDEDASARRWRSALRAIGWRSPAAAGEEA